MSGLNRHPAKVLYLEMSTVGSNPTLSTSKELYEKILVSLG
jgi:hypothetical protein